MHICTSMEWGVSPPISVNPSTKKKAKAQQSGKDYPEKTAGSEMAEKGRKECNNLTPEQREELERQAMAMIYGSPSPQAART